MKERFVSTIDIRGHPLTWISHMPDVKLFGLDPSGSLQSFDIDVTRQ